MVLTKTSSMHYGSPSANKTAEKINQEVILSRINEIAQCAEEGEIKFNEDGSLNLNGLSMRCIHNILLEAEKLGLSYAIEKSTTIKIKEAS